MENLKKLRQQKGLSQQKLANYLDISQQSVYKYENDISEPDISTLKKIADFFEISIDYLVGNTEIEQKYDNYVEESLNSEELDYIRSFRQLSSSKKKVIKLVISEFLK
ncbi:MAG: helix-turn-helix transcriptional regulator [Blautia sp.]